MPVLLTSVDTFYLSLFYFTNTKTILMVSSDDLMYL